MITLPVKARVNFKVLFFIFKAIHGIAPPYIRDLVSVKQQGSYNLRSSAGILLATPKGKTKVTLGYRSFTVATPKLWNGLPRELRAISDHIQTTS